MEGVNQADERGLADGAEDGGAGLTGATLVLGGARSGKSRYAEALLRDAVSPVYLATGWAGDAEMDARIAAHRASRDARWRTRETPVALGAVLDDEDGPVLVDCLTLWLTNLILGDHDVDAAVVALEAALRRRAAPTVLVANEVGLGIVPGDALSRRFRDEAGRLNQRIAALAGSVVFVAAGLPLRLR